MTPARLNPNVEIGGELQIPKVTEGILGRIAAQLAKQVIFQKVREAERDTVYNEYIGRVGEIVNATVKRVEGPDVIFDIGKAEARMPRKEQSRLESFAIGERVRVVIARVERASKGPAVVVSRAAPELVSAPVPDRSAGNLRRHGGDSRHCPGSRRAHQNRRHVERQRRGRGRRLRRHEGHASAVDHPRIARREDRHHRVSRRCGDFRGKSPAARQGQPRDRGRSADKHLEVVVDDSQLSLAIGKKGQNVRLAAKLLGWKIDIKSEEEKRQEVEQQMSQLVSASPTPLESVPGLGEGLIEKLNAAGVTTVEALADMTPEQLEAIEGIGPKTVEKISLAVNNYFSSLEQRGGKRLRQQKRWRDGLRKRRRMEAARRSTGRSRGRRTSAESPKRGGDAWKRRAGSSRGTSLGEVSPQESAEEQAPPSGESES